MPLPDAERVRSKLNTEIQRRFNWSARQLLNWDAIMQDDCSYTSAASYLTDTFCDLSIKDGKWDHNRGLLMAFHSCITALLDSPPTKAALQDLVFYLEANPVDTRRVLEWFQRFFPESD